MWESVWPRMEVKCTFEETQRHSCPFCEIFFNFEDILKKHITIAHEGTKLYCHFLYNGKNCPFESDCIFLHQNSTQCRYGQLCGEWGWHQNW